MGDSARYRKKCQVLLGSSIRLGFVGILHDTGKMFSFVKLRHGRALYTEIIQVFGGSTRRGAAFLLHRTHTASEMPL